MNYCLKQYETHSEKKNYGYTPCGELIFWMAETSNAVGKDELIALKNEILIKNMSRLEGNRKIKELCWEKIKTRVEKA